MNIAFRTGFLGALASAAMFAPAVALAVDIKCDDEARYMLVPDTQVSACLYAGTGNINGNLAQDPFLQANPTYALISKSDAANPFNVAYTQGLDGDDTVGTWEFDASAWLPLTKLAIGFKFGNNDPDNAFVYQVRSPTFEGDYRFVNPGQGGGFSHMNLYRAVCVQGTPGCRPPDIVPEPGTLALLGLGLLGLGFGRRRAR